MGNAILTVLGAFPDMLVLHFMDHSLLSTVRGNKQVKPFFSEYGTSLGEIHPKDSGIVGNN